MGTGHYNHDYDDLIGQIVHVFYASEGLKSLPIKAIINVDDMVAAVQELQPELLKNPGFQIEQLARCCGHTLLFDETATILIKIDNVQKISWIETLIHEVTHVRDFYVYLPLYNATSFSEMLSNIPFWYWTEFHAKYKGASYLLNFVKKNLSSQYQTLVDDNTNQIQELFERAASATDYHLKIYNIMHAAGVALATGINEKKIERFAADDTDWIKWLFKDLRQFTNTITTDQISELFTQLTTHYYQ